MIIVAESMFSGITTGTLDSNAADAGWNPGKYYLLTDGSNQYSDLWYTGDITTKFTMNVDMQMSATNGADSSWFFWGCNARPHQEDSTTNIGYVLERNDFSNFIALRFGGTILHQVNYTKDTNFDTLELDAVDGVFTVKYNGAVLFTYTDTSFPRSMPGTMYGWGARCGGTGNTHGIKNLLLQNSIVSQPVAPSTALITPGVSCPTTPWTADTNPTTAWADDNCPTPEFIPNPTPPPLFIPNPVLNPPTPPPPPTTPIQIPIRRGIALSGLEFGQGGTRGTLNTDYFNSAQATYNYFAAKGFTTVRLPFTWERLQPALLGALDPTYAGILDAEIAKAKNAGLRVILDMHNYGRYRIIADGGFTDTFPVFFDPLVQGGTPGSGVLQLFSFQRAILGSTNNPVNPATGYHITTDVTLVQDFGGNTFDNGWIEFFRSDDNNKYFFTMNAQAGQKHWELFKVVAGVQTQLDTGSFTFNYGDTHTIDIDVNQDHAGKVTVKIDGVQKSQVNTDAVLTHGAVAFFAVSIQMNMANFTLNVATDTSSANTNSGTFTIGQSQLPTTAFADIWAKIATRYANDPTVFAYDLMNEPHDMGVPTTPANYNTTSSVTLMYRAAITAIRAHDVTHGIFCELDQWAGAQNFVNNYGNNPTPWLTDPYNLLTYSFHYYFDDDHSGTYAQGFKASNDTAIPVDLTPILQWAKNQRLNIHCGEFGVPNLAEWQPCLTTFYTLANQYQVWTNHWAGGDQYTATTVIQPTGSSPNFVDRLQMAIVGATANLGGS